MAEDGMGAGTPQSLLGGAGAPEGGDLSGGAQGGSLLGGQTPPAGAEGGTQGGEPPKDGGGQTPPAQPPEYTKFSVPEGFDYDDGKVSEFATLARELNLNQEQAQKLVDLHMRPATLVDEGVTDSAVRRLLFEAGDDIDDLMLLVEADITSKNPQKVRKYLDNYILVRQKLTDIEEKDRVRNFQPPISGELIMQTFALSPCREVGLIKDAIKDAILDGTIPNEYEPAYAYMLREAEKLGLTPKEE